MTWMRALASDRAGTGVLAGVRQLRVGGREGAWAAEDSDQCGGDQGAEVDLYDAVFRQVDDVGDGCVEVCAFRDSEVTEEDGVLKPLAVRLHDDTHAPEALGVGDVVGDEVAAAAHMAASARDHRDVVGNLPDEDGSEHAGLDVEDPPVTDPVSELGMDDLSRQAAFVRGNNGATAFGC